jgi:hypothetical protein
MNLSPLLTSNGEPVKSLHAIGGYYMLPEIKRSYSCFSLHRLSALYLVGL